MATTRFGASSFSGVAWVALLLRRALCEWVFAYGLDRAEMSRTFLRGLNNVTMR